MKQKEKEITRRKEIAEFIRPIFSKAIGIITVANIPNNAHDALQKKKKKSIRFKNERIKIITFLFKKIK